MSQDSGQVQPGKVHNPGGTSSGPAWIERLALLLAASLVVLGVCGIGLEPQAKLDPVRAFASIWALGSGVALAVGTLAAGAYRSRSQIDIERLEQAAKKIHESIPKFDNVNKLLAEANKLNEHAKQIGEAYSELKSELAKIEADLAKIGGYANAAANSQDSIQALTADLRKMFQVDEQRRIAVGGAAAAELMTQWELGTREWNGDQSIKDRARLVFYQTLKEALLVDSDLHPRPADEEEAKRWHDCDGEFKAVASSENPGTILEVTRYCWKPANQSGGGRQRPKGIRSGGQVANASEPVPGEPSSAPLAPSNTVESAKDSLSPGDMLRKELLGTADESSEESRS